MLNEKIDLSKDNSALKKDNLDLKKIFDLKKHVAFLIKNNIYLKN